MKYIYILIIAMLFNNYYSSAQHKFVDKNKVWYIVQCTWNNCDTQANFFQSDTIIDGNQYHWFYRSNNEDLSDAYKIDLLREDSLGRIYSGYQDTEKLLYDNNWEIGDSVQPSYKLLIVDSIGTFEIENGETRKITYFFDPNPNWSSDDYREFWIEGIGPLKILDEFGEGEFADYGSAVTCLTKNDTLIYKGNQDCWVEYTNNNNLQNNRQITISPNPFDQQTTLQIHDLQETWSFNLYNSKGQIEKQITNIQTNQYNLKRENLNPGIYFYQIQTKSGNTNSGKIIVK